ncbi:MAG: hypothetical protein H6661_09910 [Ardenticatenaceae bacterium]|nr:hypothetical protein [Ardenticatenaceae bacterium]
MDKIVTQVEAETEAPTAEPSANETLQQATVRIAESVGRDLSDAEKLVVAIIKANEDLDTLLAACKDVLAFEFGTVTKNEGYQEAMRQWVQLRRKVRLAVAGVENERNWCE